MVYKSYDEYWAWSYEDISAYSNVVSIPVDNVEFINTCKLPISNLPPSIIAQCFDIMGNRGVLRWNWTEQVLEALFVNKQDAVLFKLSWNPIQ